MKEGYFAKVEHDKKREFVIKKLKPVKPEETAEIKELNENYLQVLKSAGVKLPNTKIIFLKGKKPIPTIIQPAFKEEELLDNIISKGDKSKVLDAFEKMLELNFKVIEASKNSWIPFGFDGTPKNLAMHNGEIYYFDTFPPYIRNKQMIKVIKTQVRPGFKKISGSIIPSILKQFFEPPKMIRSAVASSIKRRAEFEKEFKQIATRIILDHVPEKDAKPYLKFKQSLPTKFNNKIRNFKKLIKPALKKERY